MQNRKSITFVEGALNVKKILDALWNGDAINVNWYPVFSDEKPTALKLFNGRWHDLRGKIEGSFHIDGTRLICAYRDAQNKALTIFKIDMMNLVVTE